MQRIILPAILILASVLSFIFFTNPTYQDTLALKKTNQAYNEALTNYKSLETIRDALTAKYNAIPQDNLERLNHLLPDNVDNIRLIIEIERIASVYGLVLTDVHYDVKAQDTTTGTTPVNPRTASADTFTANKDYGSFDLGFATQGSYSKFLQFVGDVERNLRVVDLKEVTFTSTDTNDTYKYNFKIKTYWLKN
jgi:Tfp pilus assembly protein PilO